MSRGAFVTFEGGEGVGKSTQIRLVAGRLRDMGLRVVTTREPGGTPFAEMIREFILSGRARHLGIEGEARLFAIARRDHVLRLVRPSRDEGAVVLCDRFVDSTRALQGAGGLSEDVIDMLERRVAGDCMPDLTLLLHADETSVSARRRLRGLSDRFEDEDAGFHRAVVSRFEAIADARPERFERIDASREADDVARDIVEAIVRRLELPVPVHHSMRDDHAAVGP